MNNSLENKATFRLIDNTYSAEDARRVLITLVMDKINFLNMQIFSLQDKGDGNTKYLQQRIAELKKTLKDLQHICDNIERLGCGVDIKCNIELSFNK